MAKPGSQAARDLHDLARMSRTAADLGSGPLPVNIAGPIEKRAEEQLGLRCGGCGERITIGFSFRRIEAVMVEGKPQVDVTNLSACNGINGCEFATQAAEGATVMEAVEYAWLDEERAAEPDPAEERRRRAAG